VVLDLDTGQRFQLTQLPEARSPFAFENAPGTCCPRFVDDDTVVFATTANADGRHPGGAVTQYAIGLDRQGVRPWRLLPDPGVSVLPVDGIAGVHESGVALFLLPGTPENRFPPNTPPFPGHTELFFADEAGFRRLTTLRRIDTLSPLLSADGERVFFVSSADPTGTNPTEDCQIFSVAVDGTQMRQLSTFGEGGEHSVSGCFFSGRPGCSSLFLLEDPRRDELIFYSSCDPLGTNPNGGQVFSMRRDGTEVRQRTQTAGMTRAPDGRVAVELPGPFAYAPGSK
jgi:hypothetical protein